MRRDRNRWDDIRIAELEMTVALAREIQQNQAQARVRVANDFGLSAASLSTTVTKVEDALRVKLFGGSQRRQLTEAGRELAEWGPLLLEELEELSSMLQECEPDASDE